MLSGLSTATGDVTELIERVKTEVDVQKLIADDGTREDFGRYVRQRCIHPDHTDQNPTMLIFPDGWNCPACGNKGDAIDTFRMYHPEVGFAEAVRTLLNSPELTLDGDAHSGEPRQYRELDQDAPVRNHLALASHPQALAELMGMGFTPNAIKHYKLGYARVLVRLKPEEHDLADIAEDIDWLTVKDKQLPYQWQWRFAVPVFVGKQVKQILYRKTSAYTLGEKVTMEKDAGAQLFGYNEVEGADDVVICEGWGDKIVAWQWGFVAVTSTNGAGHWNSEWNELLGNARRIYVVADADNAGSKMLARVKRDLPWARQLTLPWPHGTKKDLRDGWLAGWRSDDVKKLMRAAYVRGSWQVVTGGAK